MKRPPMAASVSIDRVRERILMIDFQINSLPSKLYYSRSQHLGKVEISKLSSHDACQVPGVVILAFQRINYCM
jgi:hypothetical protein